jgi:hypothetical protein
VARRDGGGGDRAREFHASNFPDAAPAGAAPIQVALDSPLKRSSSRCANIREWQKSPVIGTQEREIVQGKPD